MENRLSNLKDVMAVQTASYNVQLMNTYIKNFVRGVPDCKIYKHHGNLYVTRGHSDIYPCVVAHTDTVHDIHKQFIVQRHKDVLYAINEKYERVGIGGDDKVGVFVALEILRTTPVCKVAFFRDEEVGCQGSKLADMKFFDNVAFVLQCDRQGYSDFVNNIFYSELFSDEFSKAIELLLDKYDKVESDGGMTDVWQLTENGLDVCCANMSCGYYDPHSDNEYIKISEVFKTLDLVEEIVNKLSHKRWIITQEERNRYSYSGSKYNYGQGSGYRRYGGGREDEFDAYSRGQKALDAFDRMSGKIEGDDDDWKEDYVVPEASCTQCDSKGEVCYDDTVEMYWCFGCQDYVREEMLEFDDLPFDVEEKEDDLPDGDYSDDFLSQVGKSQKEINRELVDPYHNKKRTTNKPM